MKTGLSSTDADPRPGRRRSEEKRARIARAAADLFLSAGFAGTSMDGVAAAAGVSKQTVYAHFRSKDDLFQSCIEAKIQQHSLTPEGAAADTLRAGLETLADAYLRLLSDPAVARMYRLVISEAPAHPRVAELFYASGPRATLLRLERFLARHAAELGTRDFPAAARTFMALVADQYLTRMIMGLLDAVPDAERRTHAVRATEQFLALFAAR